MPSLETSPLPLADSLDQVYTQAALSHEGERWNDVFEEFKREYGVAVDRVARAPGRVNIIGAFRSSLSTTSTRPFHPPPEQPTRGEIVRGSEGELDGAAARD